MWYEILPSLGIITAAVTVPPVFTYFLQKFTQKGNPYRRDIYSSLYDLRSYQRDRHLTGNVYVKKGLDNIPEN